MDQDSLMREIPSSDRPREKLEKRGPGSLTDSELIAIFLRTGTRGRSAIQVAQDVLKARGGLVPLAKCSVQEFRNSAKGIGPAKAVELAAIFEVGRRLARGIAERPRLDAPEAIYALLGQEMLGYDRERLQVLLLDRRFQLVFVETVSIGSLSETIAHPREILRPALIHSAASFVLVHNHPSGDPSPSEADTRLTVRIRDAAGILQIRFLDHVILGTNEGGRRPYYSFREHGVL